MMTRNRRLILEAVFLVLIVGIFVLVLYPTKTHQEQNVGINNFDSCAQAGNPIMETYPRQCRTADGRTFTEVIATSTEMTSEMIVVDSPKPGEIITSPFKVTGKARGNWYFEASFPVKLLDVNGNLIAQVPAQAKSDWMTTDFVPFEATVSFGYIWGRDRMPATLVLKNDNPSGDPAKDKSVSIPLTLSPFSQESAGTCRPTGCSGEICSDQPVASPCLYTAKYACYKEKFSVCERQSDGKCGWTQNEALTQCLNNAQ